ncbi:MAG: 1,2-phenylacetyl-CoA epoxidase subunit PaaD [Candidatus Limnocylindrales bacterium]
MTLAASALSSAAARAALADLPDPELPVVSIDELGILGRVDSAPAGVRVEIHPTFVACPATEMIRAAVVERLSEVAPGVVAEVVVVFDPPWTSDRIGPDGRAKLAAAGIAPPLTSEPGGIVVLDAAVPCPMCGSRRTRLDNLFGPTLCRTIRWCPDCRQPFEAIKPV